MTDKKANDASTRFLYGTRGGRLILHTALFLHVPALLGVFLRSPLSKGFIKPFIRKKGIDMTGFEGVNFHSFNDFFTRKKEISVDVEEDHVIAPADSLLSVYPITPDARFHIKGFDYSLQDFFEPERFGLSAGDTIDRFAGGSCLVFRLCATDYHRYCYVDAGCHQGSLGENHFIPGSLYSVQPLAAENFRIYTKNRRSWTILQTEHFGAVAQIEIGAFSVGGIINHLPPKAAAKNAATPQETRAATSTETNFRFQKGEEKGFFDLHGSTIVLLYEKDSIRLLPEILSASAEGKEFQVKIGQQIGQKL